MKADDLKIYIEFMNKNSICELEVEEEGKKIRLKKFGADTPVMMQAPVAAAQPAQTQATPTAVAPTKQSGVEIKSPMVGTFYRAPSPGAKSYVEVGQTVKPGDVVCIVEAMKLMNEIKAEVGGKIKQICIENGQAVEFGQALFVLEA